MDTADLDARHVWHPYARWTTHTVRTSWSPRSGATLHFADGRDLLDAMSSWWAAIHGYRHPRLDAALRTQLSSMAHVMFGGLTHEPGVELRPRLVDVTLTGLDHVFFSDSGSVTVEVALKMALQYQRGRGHPERTRIRHDRRRVPRRHVRRDERLRPGRRHARDVHRRPRADRRSCRDRRPVSTPTSPTGSTQSQPHHRRRRRHCRRHRRAGAAGRRRHARLPTGRRPLAPRAGRRARLAADPRRDRHRLRPHRERSSPPIVRASCPTFCASARR